MTTDLKTLKLRKLAEAPRVEFGPLSFYNPLIADGDTPTRTGIQTAAPGYATPVHSHPYVEILFIIEGEMEAWLEGGEDDPVRLGPGDSVALPADVPHAFRTAGDQTLRLLGIHSSPERIVNYLDIESDADGYPVLDAETKPRAG
jgi:mannose-6-phosphate isomerase-like protein (cupin superfamily)